MERMVIKKLKDFTAATLLKDLRRLYKTSSVISKHGVLSVKNIFASSHSYINKKCEVAGWISSVRHHKKNSFINITDGLCHNTLQIVVPSNVVGETREFKYGSSMKASGLLVESPASGQRVELLAESLLLIGPNDITYPFAMNTTTYDSEYMRKYLHLRHRQPEFAAMIRLRSECKRLIHDFFHKNDFIQIDTPILTSNDCEGAGETFKIAKNLPAHGTDSYFGDHNVNLTVSGQLHLEASNSGIAKVYSFGPTFRADNAVDRTHLAEFYMLEGEMAFIDGLNDLMNFIETFIKTVAIGILKTCGDDINKLHSNSTEFESVDVENVLRNPFQKLTYEDAIKLLQNSKNEFKVKPAWGRDIQREHEHAILKEYDNQAVFITDWPKTLKPFYMHNNADGKTVACMDLIVPGPGELFGGSVRESRYDVLQNILMERNMLPDYQWYLDIRKYGSVPHGGFGMGFERFLQFLFGIKQIRDTLPFPRYANNCRL